MVTFYIRDDDPEKDEGDPVSVWYRPGWQVTTWLTATSGWCVRIEGPKLKHAEIDSLRSRPEAQGAGEILIDRTLAHTKARKKRPE